MGIFEIVLLSIGLFVIYRFYLNESQHELLTQFDVTSKVSLQALKSDLPLSEQTAEDDSLSLEFGDNAEQTQPMDPSELMEPEAEEAPAIVLPPRPAAMTKPKKDRTQIVLLRESLARTKAPSIETPTPNTLRAPLPPAHLRKNVAPENKTTIQMGDVKLPESLLRKIAS